MATNNKYRSIIRSTASLLFVMVMCCVLSANAQMQIGDNLNFNLDGDLGWGYNGSFGNGYTTNSHAQSLLGNATARGFYFHPNFLSFQVHPYWGRTQLNSDSQAIQRSTGLDGSVSLFSGTRFPGSVSYGKSFDSNSEFRVAGIPTLGFDGSGQNFGVTWSALFHNAPQITASYSIGSAQSSLDGTQQSQSQSRNLSLNSVYRVLGFNLNGNLNHNTSEFTLPSYLVGSTTTYQGSSTGYSGTIGHVLPLRGNISFGASHTISHAGAAGTEFGGTNYMASNSFSPFRRLTLYQSANYMTDLSATVNDVALNGELIPFRSEFNSHGFFYNSGASVSLWKGINIGGYYNRRTQSFSGRSYEDSQYGGNLNFNQSSRLFGFLNFSIGVVDTASKVGNNGAGLNGNVTMNRKFAGWDSTAEFNYTHSVQTIGSVMNSSSYSYGFSTRRRVSKELSFGAAYRASHSGIVVREGDGNLSQSVSGSLQWRHYNLNTSYSDASGTAVLNAAGVLTPTNPDTLLVDRVLLYNARAFSVGGGAILLRRFSVDGGFSHFRSTTGTDLSSSLSDGTRYTAQLRYRLRKFQLMGGFSRSLQEATFVPGGPRTTNTYYVSISRWFNVF